MFSESVDVLVVGGGLSGLSAIHELQKQTDYKVNVLMLEAKGSLLFLICVACFIYG